jgi:hypothetical protein
MQSDLFDQLEASSIDGSEPKDTQVECDPADVVPGVVYSGFLNKMRVKLTSPVSYTLDDVDMNRLIGQRLKLTFKNHIQCIGCGKATNKSFSQGYCYPCFTTKAACDSCIMSPEKCHFDAGTCRESGWGEKYCNQSHYVYLANSSGVKVGITRGTQVPTRWIDQGAVQALPIFRTANRHLSGLVEVILKEHVTDKTNWRTMLKGVSEPIDLLATRDRLYDEARSELSELSNAYGLNAIQPLMHADSVDIYYPVHIYPEKVTSFNFDKEPEVIGLLNGIKGQYLIFDTGVINLRRFTGYDVAIEVLG